MCIKHYILVVPKPKEKKQQMFEKGDSDQSLGSFSEKLQLLKNVLSKKLQMNSLLIDCFSSIICLELVFNYKNVTRNGLIPFCNNITLT